MNASAYLYETSFEATPVLKEFAVVRARLDLHDGQTRVPRGSLGAIVQSYEDANVFQVEFAEPVHAVIAVRAGDLELA